LNASIAGQDVSNTSEKCPTNETLNRLVGSSNETSIRIDNLETNALIDSGSMVSSISEDFSNNMKMKPKFHSLDEFELEVKTANGTLVPYIGYIEATIECKNFEHDAITTFF
jgi:hypothetical protein